MIRAALLFWLVVLLGIFTMPITLADESIGRVFMTDATRHMLDQLRRQPAMQPRSDEGPATRIDTGENDNKRLATGFIISSSGKPYQWHDGDFEEVSPDEIDDRRIHGLVPVSSRLELPERTDSSRPTSHLANEGQPVADTGSEEDVQP